MVLHQATSLVETVAPIMHLCDELIGRSVANLDRVLDVDGRNAGDVNPLLALVEETLNIQSDSLDRSVVRGSRGAISVRDDDGAWAGARESEENEISRAHVNESNAYRSQSQQEALEASVMSRAACRNRTWL